MKSLALIAALAFTGCTVTQIQTPTWSLRRTSFLQRLEIPSVSIDTNGTATLKGYSNDGGTKAAADITAAAVSAAMKAK